MYYVTLGKHRIAGRSGLKGHLEALNPATELGRAHTFILQEYKDPRGFRVNVTIVWEFRRHKGCN